MLKRFTTFATALFLLFTLSACNGEDVDSPDGDSPQPTMTDDGQLTADDDGVVVLRPEGNQMAYAQTEIQVEAGQEIRLIFENTADAPAMSHNFLLLNTTEREVIDRVGQAALDAGSENEYVPEDEAVLAYTDMAEPGETVEVTFTAPSEPGEYQFICTFPGHYQVMQGTLIVEEA